MEVERQWKGKGPGGPDNQRSLKVPHLTPSFSPFFKKKKPPPKLSQSLLFSVCFFFPLLSFSCCHQTFLFLFISVPMAPLNPFQFFCPWSTEQCYCQLWLRTQEGHHLVTRRLSQMPLQGDLATTVVPFGISPVNMCWHCLSPTNTRTHKTLAFWQGTFFLQCCH